MTDFNEIVNRRKLLQRAFILSTGAFAASVLPSSKALRLKGSTFEGLDFAPVAANTLDTVTVPIGYQWYPLISWGDPLWEGVPGFNQKTRGTGDSQEKCFGDNNDGMHIFDINGRSVMVVNNEYCNKKIIYGNRTSGLPETLDDLRKGIAAHGISIFEVVQNNGKWKVKKDSVFNRKITADSEFNITGPAAGTALLKTRDDPRGRMAKGTFNNCGSGRTPWGTYLSCEENFSNYFSSPSNPNKSLSIEQQRYGLKTKDKGYNWVLYQDRFDIEENPNEANRHGYICEVDPSNPNSKPRKHTAMGRMQHENCEVIIAKNQKIVAYMGDDQKGEHLYRFISKGKYVEGSTSNQNLLADGTLYTAVFNDNGKGKWVDLKNSGMSDADICVYTRLAATKLGATTMDRPEWVASNPRKVEVYCALTNNIERGVTDNQAINAVNPRKNNQYGQIVRWIPDGEDHTAEGFEWDLFAMAGNPSTETGLLKGSSNINRSNMFNSPDGIAFDSKGNLWIQTDGKYSDRGKFSGMGNNQMLCANPRTGEIKRFLVGPKECEITGLTWSLDKRTMFIGIQHPGEKNPDECHFPDGGEMVPRSTIIAITREDGGEIG